MKKTVLASAMLLAFAGLANAAGETIELDYITATGNWNGGNSHNDQYFAVELSQNLSVVNTSGTALNNIDFDDGTHEKLNIVANERKVFLEGIKGAHIGGKENLICAHEIEIVGKTSSALHLVGDLTLDADVVSLKTYSTTGANAIQTEADSTPDSLVINAQKIAIEAVGSDRAAIRSGGQAEFVFNADEITLTGGESALKVTGSSASSVTINAPKATMNGNLIVSGGATMAATGEIELNGTVNEISNLEDIDGKGSAKFSIENENATLKIENNEAKALEVSAGSGMNLKALADMVSIENGAEGVKLSIGEGDYTGASSGLLGEDGKLDATSVKTEVNSVMSNTLDLASSAPLAMNRLLMNDVRKRMGDLRSAEGTHGVWARYDGGKLSGDANLENDFNTIQVGIDTVPVVDAPRFGVAFAYTKSEADMNRGSADMDAFSLAFYGTKFYDNGMFVDVIGRMATADTDVTVDGNKKGSMDNVALSLSGELGWRFDVTEKFYFEPQAELTYTYVNADTLALANGGTYEFDSVDSLMGRVGFAAGFKCPNNFGDVYVRASAVHEFLGDATVRGGTEIHEVDGKDTWVEFGVGAQFNVNKNTYVYADIERTEGAKLEEDWRANVGIRFAF